MLSKQVIPPWIQPVLWSVSVDKLDLQKDKTYIIHQTLAYGGIREWQWLFDTYSSSEITSTFLSRPYKDYRAPRFHFITHYLLDVGDHKLNPAHYVKNIPRDIRPAA